MAHYAQGHPSLRQILQQVSEIQQSNQATIRGAVTYDGPLAVRPMVIRHHGPFPNSPKITKVSSSRHRLFHQVGGNRTLIHYHGEEHPYICVEEHHLQIWDTKGARLGQWKAIQQQRIQGFLLKARYQESLLISSTPAG